MELLIGDVLQYKYDEWVYVILDIDTTREKGSGEIFYQCVTPEGVLDDTVWAHRVAGVINHIESGKISITRKKIKPVKVFPRLKF